MRRQFFKDILTVPRRALLQKRSPKSDQVNDSLDPRSLCFLSRLHSSNILVDASADHVCEVLGLLAGDVDEIWCQSCLHNADPEAVWEASGGPAVQRTCALFPGFCDRLAITSVYLHIGA